MKLGTINTKREFSYREISLEQLDTFSAGHSQGNFQQTSAMAKVREKSGTKIEFLGFFEDETLVGACLLEIHGSGIGCFAEVHDGPLLDYSDEQLVNFVFIELRKLAMNLGAVQLVITPEVVWQVRNLYGEPIQEDGSNRDGVPNGVRITKDEIAFNNILSCGFVHEGFNTGYSAVPRWRFIKDLTGIHNDDELLNSYPTSTKRNNIRIGLDSGIIVRKANRDDLPIFYRLCEMSSVKQGFDNRSYEFYENLYDNFGDLAEFDIAYIDTQKQVDSWQLKCDKFASDLRKYSESLESTNNKKRVKGRINDSKEKFEGAKKRLDKAKELRKIGKFIPVACAMFVWHDRECVYLYSGSNPEYNNFYGSNAIQYHAMSECIKRGCNRYNFYGINGIFDDKDNPGYGVLEFKQGFGGYVEEMLGYFEMPVRPFMYSIKRLAHKVLRR